EPRTRLANADANTTLDLTYRLPSEAVEAARDLLSLLDEADAFCRAGGHLVTLESSAEGKHFRTWFLGEFIRQGEHKAPRAWPEFLANVETTTDDDAEPAIPPAPRASGPPDEKRWPTKIDGTSARVYLRGDIDIDESPALRDHFNALITRGITDVILDFA